MEIMVDLETLGNGPGCAIISIGAVRFNPVAGVLADEFYVVVNSNTSQEMLRKDQSTLDWWANQGFKANAVKTASEADQGVPLRQALEMFRDWVKLTKNNKVYGNGSDFDNAILGFTYQALDMPLPWMFWNNRCYRTIKSMHSDIKINRDEGTYHNALDDAKNQAKHLIEIVRAKGLVLK
jgi:hypothetical protein